LRTVALKSSFIASLHHFLSTIKHTGEDLQNLLLVKRCLACNNMTTDSFCALCENALMRSPQQHHEPWCLGSYWQYGGPFAQAFTHAKFAGHALQMKALLQMSLDPDFLATFSERLHALGIQHISWVPAHPIRRLSRGFQVSEMIASYLSQHTHLKAISVLKCTRNDAPFSLGINKNERRKRIRGRFKLKKSPLPQRMLLIDDIKTTGATLNEAQQQLQKAGVAVWTFTLAQTPPY
jgi:predicted amidophosphoribosyltransferase